jgi:NADH dehydrogenase FAD-containing subunit
MMVWSAGLAPVKFVKESGLPLLKGRIEVNEYLRVPNSNGRIYALGDNSIINNRDEDEDDGSSTTSILFK